MRIDTVLAVGYRSASDSDQSTVVSYIHNIYFLEKLISSGFCSK